MYIISSLLLISHTSYSFQLIYLTSTVTQPVATILLSLEAYMFLEFHDVRT